MKLMHKTLPSFLDMSVTKPFKQASVTSVIKQAQRPIAFIVAAANSLSLLSTYALQCIINIRSKKTIINVLKT